MIPHNKKQWACSLFAKLASSKLKKEFHRCSITKDSQWPQLLDNVPTIAISNHSSWWDALLMIYMSHFYIKRQYYGVFDEEQLKRYPIFKMLGAYSINRTSKDDGRRFLKYTKQLLENQSRIVWVFPQGDLISNGLSPMEFKRGFAQMIGLFPKVQLLKTCVSYDFWLESKPEIVIDILPVETIVPEKGSIFTKALTRRVESEMNGRLSIVNNIVCNRNYDMLTPLFVEGQGTHPVYDAYRKIKSILKKESFSKDHKVQMNATHSNEVPR